MLQPLVIFVSLVMTIRASSNTLGKSDGFPSFEGFKKAFQTSSSFLPTTTEEPIGDSYDDLDSSDYADILERVSFYGQWLNVGGPSQLFGYFEKSTGYMSVQDADSDESDTALLDLNIVLYDGRYVDQKFVQIEVQTPMASLIFNQTNASLSGQQLNVTASIGNDNNVKHIITCMSDIDIYFLDIKDNQPFTAYTGKKINDVGIQISLQSANCSIAVLSEILTTNYMSQDNLMIYVSLMVCSAIVGMISSNKLLVGFPDSVTKLSRICVWSIWLVNAWDFYLFLYHIALAVTLSGWLMLVALAFFALSIISQTKLVYGIYVSSNRRGAHSSLASGFKFFALYYGLLYLLVFSYSYLSNSIWSVLSSSFYLTPQIIQVFIRGRKYKFNFWHIVGLGVTRIAFVGYIKVATGNIFKLSPDYRFVAIYAAIIFGQVTTLSLQRILPKFCLTPKPFRYLVKVTDSQEKEEICPICMDILQDEPFSAKKGLLLEDEKTIMVMQTPCKHRFHEDCLLIWMKTKLECPSCRQVVPSLNNEEVD